MVFQDSYASLNPRLTVQDTEMGMGVIFVTHDLGVAGEIAARVAVMYAGRFIEEGPVADLMRAPLRRAPARVPDRGAVRPQPGAGLRRPVRACARPPAAAGRRMIHYLLRRILRAVPIALAVSLVYFMLVHIAPGDPINAIVPADAPQAVVEQIRHEYGLDKPLPVQFGLWLMHVGEGDLGRSFATGRSVWSDLGPAVVNTLRLALTASLIGFVMGVLLGGLAGAFRDTGIDRAATAFAVAGVSIPHYWLGMVLVILFSVTLGQLPAMGAGPGGATDWAWD